MMAATSADTNMVADDLVDRINALAAERTALYRRASDGATPEQRARLKEVEAELAALWEQRRRARAGRDDADDVPVRRAA